MIENVQEFQNGNQSEYLQQAAGMAGNRSATFGLHPTQ
jgi:hypothetical protein